MNTDHITTDPEVRGAFRCSHCGALHIPEPMAIEQLASVCRGFVLMHKHCPKPVAPSRQVELFDELARKERRASSWVPLAAPEGGIDGMSDEPDPETDPPGYTLPDEPQEHDKPPFRDLFAEMYPMARTTPELWAELVGFALSPEQAEHLLSKPLPPAGSAAFDAIAHYSRCLKARDAGEIEKQRAMPLTGEDGLYIPLVPPMPKELRALLGKLAPKSKQSEGGEPKKKRARKPKSEPSFHGSGGVD